MMYTQVWVLGRETVAPNGNVNNVVQVDNAATNDSSLGKIKEGSNVYVESNSVAVSKEKEAKVTC